MADNQYQNNRPKAPKTLLDDPFLRLTAPCPTPAGQAANRKSKLGVVLKKYNPQSLRNPHFVVYTGDPGENDQSTDYGKIIAKFDYGTWGAAIEMIRQAIDWEPGKKDEIVVKDKVFGAGGQRSAEALPQAFFIVGKDKEGVVCLSIRHFKKERPVIVFRLLPPAEFFDFKHGDGTPYTNAEMSVLYTRAYVKRMEDVVQQIMVDTFEEPPPYDPNNKGGGNRGGGGGNYQRGGGGGGNNYQRGGNGGGYDEPASGGGGGGGDEWGGDIPF